MKRNLVKLDMVEELAYNRLRYAWGKQENKGVFELSALARISSKKKNSIHSIFDKSKIVLEIT